MKKFRVLMLGLVLIFAMGSLTACKKVKNPTKDDVIEALIDEEFLTEEESEDENFSVKLEDVDVNDDKDRATVECVTTVLNGSVNVIRTYEVKFKIRDDKTWKVREVELLSSETELAAGITDDEIKELLSSEYTLAGDDYINFGNEKTTYEIGKHETDLKEKTDKVTITGSTETNYEKITFEIVYTFQYSSRWRKSAQEVVSVEKDYLESYKLAPTGEEIYASWKAKDVSFTVMGYRYYLTTTGVEITDIKVGEAVLNGNNAEVPVVFTIKMMDVAATLDATVKYRYSDSQWSYSSVYSDGKLSAYKCDGQGTWTGTHDSNNITVVITDEIVNDKYLKAEVTGTTESGEVYKYSAYVDEYEPGNSFMSVEASDWIQRPVSNDVSQSDYTGYYKDGVFTPEYSWSKWQLTKQGTSTEQPTETPSESPSETPSEGSSEVASEAASEAQSESAAAN